MARQCTRVAVTGAGIASGMMSPAVAQTTLPDTFSISPALRATYDSNLLRVSEERVPGDHDDFLATPGVDIDVRRLIAGRHLVTVNGTIGYDLHRKFRFLDRERINLDSSVDIVTGQYCRVQPGVGLNWGQTQLSDQGVILGNTERRTDYQLSVTCRRPVGLYYTTSGQLSRVVNSAEARSRFNLHDDTVQVGIGYALPSIGEILILGSFERFERPELAATDGANDRTNSYQIGGELRRAVAPRISFRLGGYYLRVEPRQASWPSFSGVSFNAAVQYHPSPALNVDVQLRRNATSQSNISSAYVIQFDARLTASLATSARGRLQAGGAIVRRDFKGELLVDTPFPRDRDRTSSAFAGYSHDINRRLRAGLAGRYERRTAPLSYYEYSSASVTATLSARF